MLLKTLPLKFIALHKRWVYLNFFVILYYLSAYFLATLTDILKKNRGGIIFMLIAALILFIRFYIVQLFRDIKKINHIVRTINIDQQICVETFPVSILFGLINRNTIELAVPIGEIVVRETPKNWPLYKRTMKSENNFAIVIAGEQFYLIRSLFEDSDIFDRCIEELSAKS